MADGSKLRIVFNDLPKLENELRTRAVAAVRKAAFDIEAEAKLKVPVDTGALKNSIQVWFEGDLHAFIAPHMEYGHFVEFGTRKMAARPYMTPAAEKVRPDFLGAMQRLIK